MSKGLVIVSRLGPYFFNEHITYEHDSVSKLLCELIPRMRRKFLRNFQAFMNGIKFGKII